MVIDHIIKWLAFRMFFFMMFSFEIMQYVYSITVKITVILLNVVVKGIVFTKQAQHKHTHNIKPTFNLHL